MAVFCDFENVAIGAREARFEAFDISLVLERLLDKGKILVKKAYADWTRYKGMRRKLHEASFELIEIPHVSISGKNSADIRLVVDALDLCYTKAHIDTVVVVSGDSDFSPLVGKLRENNKWVIGIGVKKSTSDLLIESCDEFIYYDDLVRDRRKARGRGGRGGRRGGQRAGDQPAPAGEGQQAAEAAEAVAAPEPSAEDTEILKLKALDLVLDTVDKLFRERDDAVWGSMVKQTLKRKRPNFSESFHGYRNFTQLLQDAQRRGLLEIEKDQKSGGFIVLGFGPQA